MIRDALVEVLRHDIKEVQPGLTSISGVDVSPDLHFARVYITGLTEDDARASVEALQGARGRVRKFLGQRIRLRYTPELDFRYDDTAMRAGRIEEILTRVAPKEAEESPDGADVADAGEPE